MEALVPKKEEEVERSYNCFLHHFICDCGEEEEEKKKVNACKPFGMANIKTLENWRNTCFESEDKVEGSKDINVFVAFFFTVLGMILRCHWEKCAQLLVT